MNPRLPARVLSLPRIAVFCFVAVAGCTLLMGAYRWQHAVQRIEAARFEAQREPEINPPTCAHDIGGRFSCVTTRPAPTSQNYATHDLHAQQDMAEWALGVFIASIGTLTLTAIGVYLLWQTLVATRDTLNEAEQGTKAAQDAVTVTREIGEAQFRCYPSVSNVQIMIDRDDDNASGMTIINANPPFDLKNKLTPRIRFEVTNYGQSPALNVFWVPTIAYLPIAIPPAPGLVSRHTDIKYPVPEEQHALSWGESIPTGKSHAFSSLVAFPLSTADQVALASGPGQGSLVIVLVVSLCFADVFGKLFSEDRAFLIAIANNAQRKWLDMSPVPLSTFHSIRATPDGFTTEPQ